MKRVIEKLEDVAEPFRAEYEAAKDGRFVLKCENDPVSYDKFCEFRDNNIALNTKVKEHATALETAKAALKAFDGVDPAEYIKLKGRVEELTKAGAGTPDAMKEVVDRAVKAAVGPVQERLEAITAAQKETEARERAAQVALQNKDLEAQLTSMGLKVGVDEKALEAYKLLGQQVFKVEDGKVVAKSGDSPRFSRLRPTEPLSIEEWANDLAQEQPYLFKPSKGGGAPGGAGGGNGRPRVVPAGAPWSDADIKDIAAGKAVPAQ